MMSSFGLGRNIPVICEAEKHCGSSPRMRGKRWLDSGARRGLRIIPAHAGQTTRPTPAMMPSTDHPRACGANSEPQWTRLYKDGSSPRMRGKLQLAAHGKLGGRIIPAHAGQTRRRRSCLRRTPDHPRACGANACFAARRRSSAGSSPRMRGKPLPRDPRQGPLRIIPAHAGQTSKASRARDAVSDHPRACGANRRTA